VNVIPNERVVIDKNIVTSFCPETAADVAFVLLGWLVGKEKAAVVSSAMGY
jgi:4-methyl-5(b-hydroxyethyl)-thiazole monophosphate biosynthesis